MKPITALFAIFLAIAVHAQDKNNYIVYNKLTIVEGTPYMIAAAEDLGKKAVYNDFLLFINTLNGQVKQVDFPKGAILEKYEQIKIDSLGINLIIAEAKTVNLDGNKSIDWNDPRQVFILSTDGHTKTKLTEDRFFASRWAVNKLTGAIVITGHYDTNNNGKYDKTDENQVLLFNLKTLALIAKF